MLNQLNLILLMKRSNQVQADFLRRMSLIWRGCHFLQTSAMAWIQPPFKRSDGIDQRIDGIYQKSRFYLIECRFESVGCSSRKARAFWVSSSVRCSWLLEGIEWIGFVLFELQAKRSWGYHLLERDEMWLLQWWTPNKSLYEKVRLLSDCASRIWNLSDFGVDGGRFGSTIVLARVDQGSSVEEMGRADRAGERDLCRYQNGWLGWRIV